MKTQILAMISQVVTLIDLAKRPSDDEYRSDCRPSNIGHGDGHDSYLTDHGEFGCRLDQYFPIQKY